MPWSQAGQAGRHRGRPAGRKKRKQEEESKGHAGSSFLLRKRDNGCREVRLHGEPLPALPEAWSLPCAEAVTGSSSKGQASGMAGMQGAAFLEKNVTLWPADGRRLSRARPSCP